MKRKKSIWLCLIFFFFLVPGASSKAAPSLADFQAGPDLFAGTTGEKIVDLKVTPDDRFVVLLLEQSIRFLDTWTFSVVEGTTAVVSVASGNTTAKSLALSPDGAYAYAGLSTGALAVIDLSPVYDWVPGEPFPFLSSAQTFFITDPDKYSLDRLAVVKDSSGGSDLYLLMGTTVNLYWAALSSGGAVASSGSWAVANKPFAVSGGGLYGFQLYDSGGFWIEAITCSGNACSGGVDFLSLTGAYSKMVTEPDNLYTIALEALSIKLIDTSAPAFMAVLDSFTASLMDHDLALMTGFTDFSDLVFTAGGNTITIIEISLSPSPQFSGSYEAISSADWNFSKVAVSSGADGYAFAAAGDTLMPVSANPWVEALQVRELTAEASSGGDTVQVTSGYSVSFRVSSPLQNYDYEIHNSRTFGAFNSPVVSGTQAQTGDTITVGIDASALSECENLLTLIPADGEGRKGRKAVSVVVDTLPPPQSFNLSFGDRKLIVEFTVPDLCDLARYEIYYGSDPAVLDYDSLQSSYQRIDITAPAAGEKVRKIIENLQNGVRYYVWVAIVDDGLLHGQKVNLGSRLSAIPQPSASLTKLTGEEGGLNCLPALSGIQGDPKSLVLPFAVPLLFGIGYGLFRRWSR